MADLHIDIEDFDKDDDDDDDDEEDDDETGGVSQPEVTCLCCYNILLDPTTLSCGHSFCRHCLAMWVRSSKKTICPTCRSVWHGCPKVNISFRDLLEKYFQADLARRRQSIMANSRIVRALQVFQQTERGIRRPDSVMWFPWRCPGGFFTGVLFTLSFTAVVYLVHHWSAGDEKVERLMKKPIGAWTPDEVTMWVENLGTWTSPYRDIFHREQVNGRLLNALGEQDLLKPPYGIENELHRRTMLNEIRFVQELGFKRPQNLWEYKAVNGGKSLFLLQAMTDSPRLAIIYMYFFDYYDSFLPFLHVSCPSVLKKNPGDDLSFRNLDSPDWRQWLGFTAHICFLPYRLSSIFAWEWQEVHFWTSRLVMWQSFILTLREGQILWSLLHQIHLRKILHDISFHVCSMVSCWIISLFFWKFLHQFFWDCLFYSILYLCPFSSTSTVLNPLLRELCPYIFNRR